MKHKKLKIAVKQGILLSVLYLLIVLLMTRFEYAYGSVLDWCSQHYVFPDYFRKLFYETGDLFPDFAANLGAGENIYDFSYYGLFSPVIMLSYLFPFISMRVYIQIISILGLWLSVMLFHRFLNKRFGLFASFVGALLFLFSPPLIFNSHRHIMFVSYMPFHILSFESADKLIKSGRRASLILCMALMILCNYYFCVPAIIAVTVYAVFSYLKNTENATLKTFWRNALNYAFCAVTSVMISAVLLLPSFATILKGRDKNDIPFDLSILIPHIVFGSSGITPQAFGLSAFGILAVAAGILSKKKERRFLGIVIGIVSVFPVFIWLLNGGMYLEGKVLIPFVPLLLLLNTYLLEDLKRGVYPKKKAYIMAAVIFLSGVVMYDTRYDSVKFLTLAVALSDAVLFIVFMMLYIKKHKRRSLICASVIVTALVTLASNFGEELISIDLLEWENSETMEKMTNVIAGDKELVRSSVCAVKADTVNMVYNTDYYSPYVYSSIHNKYYTYFYFDVMKNENEYRNSALTACSWNMLFNIFMGNKYLITNKTDACTGYEELLKIGNLSLYKNNYCLPIGRSTDKIISEKYFDTLDPTEQSEALMNYIVVNDNSISNTAKFSECDYSLSELPETDKIRREKDGYYIHSKSGFDLTLPLSEPIPKDKLLMLYLDIDNSEYDCDARIKINEMRNTITKPSWKYRNNNDRFEYVISTNGKEKLDKLDMRFSEGEYHIKNIRCRLIDFPDNIRLTGEFKADKNETKGDVISGSINCLSDGYFIMTIPYDEGFEITVDGKKQDYECVDKAFIGFELSKGRHNVKFEYHAPLKTIGLAVSAVGTAVLAAAFVYEIILKKKRDKLSNLS